MSVRPETKRRTLFWGKRQSIGDCGCKRGGISRRYNPAGKIWRRRGNYILGCCTNIGDDDGATHGLRLDTGAAKGLRGCRGDHRHFRESEGRGNVVAVPDETSATLKSGSLDVLLKLLSIGIAPLRIASEDKNRLAELICGQHSPRRLDDMVLAFPACQPRRVQNNGLIFLHAPACAEPVEARGLDRLLREMRWVDAAIDHPHAFHRHVMTRGDQPGRVVRVGDDAVASRHDAAVERLERCAAAIGAVIGGHEGALRPPRRKKRAPGRGPAPRMKKRDVARFDDLRQPACIGQNGDGVLARHRQGDDLAAGVRDSGCHTPPFGGNQGLRAGAGERLRDFDGRLLAAPGIEPRHDLQYGHLCHDPRPWRKNWNAPALIRMDQQEPQILEIGQGPKRRRIAYRLEAGAGETSPAVVWLSGFLSDMTSTKVGALSDWARGQGYAMLRFDYSGHGVSGGDILQACVGDWLEEATAMLALAGNRRLILVGSSLGGWVALLLARALAKTGDSLSLIHISEPTRR